MALLKNTPIEHLPILVGELIGLIGMTHTETLIRERGGIRLYVPKYASGDHWLAKLLSVESLEKLVAVYGGEELELPRCDAAIRAARDMEIYGSEESNSALARRYSYTERGIRKLKRRVGNSKDDRQGKLL